MAEGHGTIAIEGGNLVDLYKMILVDDEEDVRGSIERKLDWKSLGFEIVGSVNNGDEALELTEQRHVDVVMTDIKMPFMDGLTLCAHVKKNYKNTKVVVYTGFDDFEFAREAVHLDVEEYLLKPIRAKDLEAVFRKIKENLDKEFDERRNLETLHDYYQKSLPMMQEQLLVGMLEGKFEEIQVEALIESYGMDFSAPYYCVSVFGEDYPKEKRDVQTSQMLMLSLMNLAKEYLEKYLRCNILMLFGRIIVIARLQDEESMSQFVYHVNQVCKMGSRMLNLKLDAGIGQAYAQKSQISTSYEEAKIAFNYRVLGEESGHAIYINDVEPKVQEAGNQEFAGISNIIHAVRFGTEEEVNASVDKFIGELYENKPSAQQYQLVLMEMITEMLKLLRSYQIEASEVFGINFFPYRVMENLPSLEEYSAWLKTSNLQIWDQIGKLRTHSTNVLTEKAKLYIEENYAQSDLSVEELCKYLNISATYLSVLFKKEIGMSFVSYLTKVRLEHAVELLNNTEDKSYMIAEKVGYTEPNYFSYVFKKQYGVSPSKYRTNKGI